MLSLVAIRSIVGPEVADRYLARPFDIRRKSLDYCHTHAFKFQAPKRRRPRRIARKLNARGGAQHRRHAAYCFLWQEYDAAYAVGYDIGYNIGLGHHA